MRLFDRMKAKFAQHGKELAKTRKEEVQQVQSSGARSGSEQRSHTQTPETSAIEYLRSFEISIRNDTATDTYSDTLCLSDEACALYGIATIVTRFCGNDLQAMGELLKRSLLVVRNAVAESQGPPAAMPGFTGNLNHDFLMQPRNRGMSA